MKERAGTPIFHELGSAVPTWFGVTPGVGLRARAAARTDHRRNTLDAVAEFAQSQGCHVAERFFLLLRIAETCAVHLLCGSGESPGTYLVHIKELKCLGKGYPFGSRPEELNMGRHFAKHSLHGHFAQRSLGDGALCKNDRTSGEGKTLNYSDKILSIDGE